MRVKTGKEVMSEEEYKQYNCEIEHSSKGP